VLGILRRLPPPGQPEGDELLCHSRRGVAVEAVDGARVPAVDQRRLDQAHPGRHEREQRHQAEQSVQFLARAHQVVAEEDQRHVEQPDLDADQPDERLRQVRIERLGHHDRGQRKQQRDGSSRKADPNAPSPRPQEEADVGRDDEQEVLRQHRDRALDPMAVGGVDRDAGDRDVDHEPDDRQPPVLDADRQRAKEDGERAGEERVRHGEIIDDVADLSDRSTARGFGIVCYGNRPVERFCGRGSLE
jgi:hypothetical protein